MKNNVTFNPKRDLPYLAAVAQTILYTWAGVTLLGFWGWIPGAATGLLVSMTIAYASSQYAEVAKERRGFVFWGMVFLGALSPVVIGTSMYLDLPAEIHPVWRGVVGAALGVIPDVSVFLTGFVAGKGLVKRDEPAVSEGQSETKPKAKPEKPRFVCSCGFVAKSQAALNGHKRAHSKVVGYVASFEPVTSGKVAK